MWKMPAGNAMWECEDVQHKIKSFSAYVLMRKEAGCLADEFFAHAMGKSVGKEDTRNKPEHGNGRCKSALWKMPCGSWFVEYNSYTIFSARYCVERNLWRMMCGRCHGEMPCGNVKMCNTRLRASLFMFV